MAARTITAVEYKKRLNLPFVPSDYQTALLNEVENGRGNCMVQAVAGSGKTKSIEIAISVCYGSKAYMVFGKKNQLEATEKMSHIQNLDILTTFSHGLRTCSYNCYRGKLGKLSVEDDKYHKIIRSFKDEILSKNTLFGRNLEDYEIEEMGENAENFPFSEIDRLLDLARYDLIDFNSNETKFRNEILDLADHHDLIIPGELENIIISCVNRAMVIGAANRTIIDVIDEIWHPHIHNYRPKQYMTLFVDECQDLNKAQQSLIKKSVARGGRIIAVGDPRQSIFGFAGADTQAFSRLQRELRTKLMPLSVCYRCPKSGIELAKQWCPEIEAAPNAPEGIHRTIEAAKLDDEINPGDLILSRTTAPLIKTCFSLIASGVGARVLGREIGQGLVKVIKTCNKSFGGFDADAITRWEAAECAHVSAGLAKDDPRADSMLESVRDKAECLRIVYGRNLPKDIKAFENAIGDLFTDNKGAPSVLLATVHRAKGLESTRVFIIDPDRILKPRARRDWQLEQERNLAYVAHTRHKLELIYVR